MLANKENRHYDDKGETARSGSVNNTLLTQLNALDYYRQPYPKSLANEFGTGEVFPLIESFNISTADSLRTYVEHIVQQVMNAIGMVNGEFRPGPFVNRIFN